MAICDIIWLIDDNLQVGYWFTKIIVLNEGKLIIINDLAHLQHYFSQHFSVPIGSGFY